jgi:hypothetical protein
MEGSRGRVAAPAARETNALRVTQVGLLIAALGAFLVVFDLFGLAIAGLVLAAVGAVLAAPGGVGHGWYVAVALGAIVVVLSRLIADSAETLGGWLAIFGSIAIFAGTALGYPGKASDL